MRSHQSNSQCDQRIVLPGNLGHGNAPVAADVRSRQRQPPVKISQRSELLERGVGDEHHVRLRRREDRRQGPAMAWRQHALHRLRPLGVLVMALVAETGDGPGPKPRPRSTRSSSAATVKNSGKSATSTTQTATTAGATSTRRAAFGDGCLAKGLQRAHVSSRPEQAGRVANERGAPGAARTRPRSPRASRLRPATDRRPPSRRAARRRTCRRRGRGQGLVRAGRAASRPRQLPCDRRRRGRRPAVAARPCARRLTPRRRVPWRL